VTSEQKEYGGRDVTGKALSRDVILNQVRRAGNITLHKIHSRSILKRFEYYSAWSNQGQVRSVCIFCLKPESTSNDSFGLLAQIVYSHEETTEFTFCFS